MFFSRYQRKGEEEDVLSSQVCVILFTFLQSQSDNSLNNGSLTK